MATRFRDISVDRAGRLSLGVDSLTGQPYISIPVANRLVDYEEYYRLTEAELHRFEGNPAAARLFADECRERAHDDRLIIEPGPDRGEPG